MGMLKQRKIFLSYALTFPNSKGTQNVYFAGVGQDQTTNYTGYVVCPLIDSDTYLDGTA